MDPTNEGVSRDMLDRLEERKHAFSCRMYGLVDIMSRTVFARMEKRTSVYKNLLDQLVEQMFGLFRHELDAAWRDGWNHRDSSLHQCICRDDILDSEIESEYVLMNGGVGGDVLDRLEERKHAFSCRMYGLVDIMSRTVFARMEKRTSVYKDLLDKLVEQMFGLFSHELDAAWKDGWAHRDSSMHQCIYRDDVLDSKIVSESEPISEQTLSQVSSPQQSLPECIEEMDDGECYEIVCDEQENWIVEVDDDEMAHNLDCVEENLNEFDQSNDLSMATDSIATGDDEIYDENDEDCDMGEDAQHVGDCVVLPNVDDHVDDVEAKNDDDSTLPQPSSTLPQSSPTLPQTSSTLPQSSPTLPQPSSTLSQQSSTQPQSASALPQTSSTQPQSASTLPQTSSTQPQSASTLPQTSSTQPQSASTLPQTSSTQPQSASTLPQTSSTQPQSASTLPQTSSTQPQSASALPQPSPTLPQTSSTLPQTSPTLPQTSPTLPQPSSTLPQSSSTLPQTSSTQPQSASALPQPSSTLTQTSSSLPQQKLYACPRENCDRTFASRRGIRIHFKFHDSMSRLLGENEEEIEKQARFDDQAIRNGRKLSMGKFSIGSGSKEAKICYSEHGDDRLNGLGDRVNLEGTQEGQFAQNKSSEKVVMVEKQSQTNDHVCLTCDRVFKKASDLKRHIPKHSRQRPHACTLDGCKEKFRKFKHLKTHNRSIHTESPHICPRKRCHQTFAQKRQLREHYMSHSDGKRFKCPLSGCEKIYTFENTMKHHYKTQHRSILANSILKTLESAIPNSTKITSSQPAAQTESPLESYEKNLIDTIEDLL